MRTADNLAAGMSPQEARRDALLRFGNRAVLKERVTAVDAQMFLDSAWQDLLYGLRMLRKSPGFTVTAILTLAIGIGANAAIFSLTDQVLLRTLPVPDPQQLVRLRSPGPNPGRGFTRTDYDGDAGVFSYPMYKELRQRLFVFSGLLAWSDVDYLNVSGHGTTQTATGELVSGNFFETLGVTPALGRVFSMNDETTSGANPVAVLSYGYWSRQFGADPLILNKTLSLNGVALTIVGVARKDFYGVQVGFRPDIFVPLTMKSQLMPLDVLKLDAHTDHWLPLLGRLKPGITREQAQALLQPTYAELLREDAKLLKLSGNKLNEFLAKPLQLRNGSQGLRVLQHDAEAPLLVLTGMVALILLIACANLASLLMARGEARQREIAVRLALGAGRWRLVRQLLTESSLVGVAGGATGLGVAWWCLSAMVQSIPPEIGMAGLEATPDARVLWFALAATFSTTVVFGLAPAIRATGVDTQAMLKDQSIGASEGRSNVQFRKILIAAQVALTAVLFTCAGLLARTLRNLEHANLGMRTDHILQFSVAPGLNGYSPAQTLEFAARARRALAALPGVRSVAASAFSMFAGDDHGFTIVIGGYAGRPTKSISVLYDYVGSDYFSTMGIPLIAGREFGDSDTADSQKALIVNRNFAQRAFPGRNPVGLRIGDMEVVGVVDDSKWDSPADAIGPFVYEPDTQDPQLSQVVFYARTDGPPDSIPAAVRSVIRELDANLPINNMRTLSQQVNGSTFDYRLVAMLSVAFAVLAGLLAAIGLYGVLAYIVARRTREIGIRMALGGQNRDILRFLLRQALWIVLMGGAIGAVGALAAARLLASLLYGVAKYDPLTLASVIALLVAISVGACYIPARRAIRVDPMVALRHE
jgi:putative ABC transport system permease protein